MVNEVDGKFCASLPQAGGAIFLGVWSEEMDASCVVRAARFLLWGGPEPRLRPTAFRAAQKYIDQHQAPPEPKVVPEEPKEESPKRARILAMLQDRPLHQVRVCLGLNNADIREHLAYSHGYLFQALSDLSVPEATIHELVRA